MDRTALEQELEALHAQSFAWALACCDHRRADAEDVLQTAYLKVLDGRARFDSRSTLRTWLFGVIRRTAAEERRRAWLRLRGVHNGRVDANDSSELARADADLEREERNASLIAALRTLPRRQREVLELVFYHDMTVEQAGVVMGVSVGTARTHYHRAKQNLHARLDTEELS
jgi:RNA polymerase sigma factor (sigma-70 family)